MNHRGKIIKMSRVVGEISRILFMPRGRELSIRGSLSVFGV